MSCVTFSDDLVLDVLWELEINDSDSYNGPSLDQAIQEIKQRTGNKILTPDMLNTMESVVLESAKEDGVDIITEGLRDRIEQAWNKQESSQAPVSTDKLVNLDADIPSIKKGLFEIFFNSSDMNNFIRTGKALTIQSIFINPENRTLVTTDRDLNNAVISLHNVLAEKLSKYLKVPYKPIYENRKFNKETYDNLIMKGYLAFSGMIKEGTTQYVFPTKRDRENFNNYLLLANFDEFIEKFSGDVISIHPIMFGNKNVFAEGNKYTLARLHVKQYWDENHDDLNTNTSKVVQQYISSIPEVDSKGNSIPGSTVSFRDFNSLIRLIRDNNFKYKGLLRDYPNIALKYIMDEIKQDPKRIFRNADYVLRNTFESVYNAVFANNPLSVYGITEASNKSTENDLYSMICNHINKMSSTTYKRAYWDKDENMYRVATLTSENLTLQQTSVEKHLSLNASSLDYSDIVSRYNVKFNTEDNKIESVTFTIGDTAHTISFSGSIPTITEPIVNNFSTSPYVKFFSEVFRLPLDADFMNGLIQVNSPGNNYKLLNLAANVLLANQLRDVKSQEDLMNALKLDYLKSDNSRRWYYTPLKSLRVGGFNNALGGLEALSRGTASANKDITKSNVKNAEGSNLPKYRLTNLSNDDIYVFNKLNSEVVASTIHPMAYNLFVPAKMHSMLTNFFKTDLVNKDGDSKAVSQMTDQELLYEQFVFGYLANRNDFIDIQPAVYADKSTIQGKSLDAKAKFTYKNDAGEVIIDNKSFSELSSAELNDLFYHTMRGQFKALKSILKSDYDTLFGTLAEIYPSKKFSVKNTYEEYGPELAKLNTELVYEAVKAAANKGIVLEISPEIHYTYNKKGKKFEFNNLLTYYFKQFTTDTRDAFNDKNLEEERNYAEALRAAEVKFEVKFSDGTENKAVTANLNMKENQIPYLSSKVSKGLDKLIANGSSYEDVWVDKNTQTLRNYILVDSNGNIVENETISLIGNNEYTVILNPELQRFKLIDNIVSNNYNAATVGLAFLHPTKQFAKDESMAELKLEESARTTALNKRGVVYGATGHTFLKNKRNGIPQIYNLAVIQDLESKNISLTGKNEDATQADGAVYINPLINIWEKNSLSELALSSVHKKPLGYYSKGKYMASGLLKCATFAINNMFVRESQGRINGENLMRNMLGKEWMIPNLDISKYLDCHNLFYSSEDSLNKFYELVKLEKNRTELRNNKVNNVYTATIIEVDKQGKRIGAPTIKTYNLNNNYDVWKLLGGAYSKSLMNGQLENSENSVEVLAEIANRAMITGKSAELTELLNLTGKLITIPDLDIASNIALDQSESDVPKKYLKISTKGTYFQPMKQSDVHYLANASGIKNGMTNVNPGSIYINSVSQRIEPTDQLIFGHPAAGKSVAARMGYDMISFDDVYRDQISNFISKKLSEPGNVGKTKNDYKKERSPEYQAFLLDLLRDSLTKGKQVFFSDMALLDAITADGDIAIDKIVTMSTENFVERSLQRGSKEEDIPDLLDWKANLDIALQQYISEDSDVEVIDATGHNLYEYFDSALISSEMDPNYLVIQLNAEHDIEDEAVSEMTQVISELEQGAYTHELANQVLSDIGQEIFNKIQEYRKFDIDTEKGRSEIYKKLGKALVRTFTTNEGDSVSLATAYLQFLKEEIFSNKLLSEMKDKIPFDDNNIFGALVTNFKNGFNKDIIKRKFPGFAAVLNPSHDIYTVFDYNGRTISSSDFEKMSTMEQVETLKDLLAKLDVDTYVGEIRQGDWVEVEGQALMVNTLANAEEGEISLLDIKDMRASGNLMIKKLGSKGRNLRAQNYSFLVDISSLNLPIPEAGDLIIKFDQYDLDSVRLSHYLDDYLSNKPSMLKMIGGITMKQYLDNVLVEVGKTVNKYYPNVDVVAYARSKNKDKLAKAVKLAIQEDMNLLQSGQFRVPLLYRGTDEFVPAMAGEYSANELAVGKPWATKFLLEPGDTISDVNGVEFFKNKLASRNSTTLPDKFYDLHFNARNYIVHFSSDPNIVEKIQKTEGLSIQEAPIEVIVNDTGQIRKVNDSVYYPITDNMKIYRVTDQTGATTELIVGATDKNIIDVWSYGGFYNRKFNFSKSFKDFDKLSSLFNLYKEFDDVHIKDTPETLEELLGIVSKLSPSYLDNILATKMYRSFNEALRFVAARIPAQSMQSFMNMKIVGFLETDTNIAYVPIEMLIYEGSDFDIDKIYLMGAGISDSGSYIGWSPYFRYESEALFEKSKELPMPNGRSYVKSEEGVDVSRYNDEVTRLTREKKYGELLYVITDILNAVNNSDSVSMETSNEILHIINRHNRYKFKQSDAMKNKIFANIWKIGADPRNYLAETATLTIKPARDAAEASTSGKFSKVISNDNPGAKMVSQLQNSVGKTSIGAYANGTKVFAALLNYFQEGLTRTNTAYDILLDEARKTTTEVFENPEDLINFVLQEARNKAIVELMGRESVNSEEDAEQILESLVHTPNIDEYLTDADVNSKQYIELRKLQNNSDVGRFEVKLHEYTEEGVTPVSKFTVYTDEGESFEISQKDVLPNVNINTWKSDNVQLEEIIQRLRNAGFQEDVFETLGVMLNISTDNAKELVLEKINAAGGMASVYIYLLNTGVPLETITKFMTTKIISLINRKSQRSIISENAKFANLRSAIDYYLLGVPMKNYFEPKYGKQIASTLKDLGFLKDVASNKLEITVNELSTTESGRAELRRIMKAVTDNAKKFKYSTKSLAKEEVETMDDDTISEFFKRTPKKEVSYMFNRFLEECIKRGQTLESLDSKAMSNVETLAKFSKGAEEVSMLAKLCGINQGLKTSMMDTFNYVRSVTDFVNKRLPDDVYFDFYRFIKDPQYKQDMIQMYQKTSFNILDVISNSPHFSKMFEAMELNEEVLRTFSTKYRMYNRLGTELVYRGVITNITPEYHRTISRFIDDVILDKFFSELQFDVALEDNETVYVKQRVLKEPSIKTLSLNTVYERASFKRLFETSFIPELKAKYPDNKFIQGLIQDFNETVYGVDSLYKLPINLNNIEGDENQNIYSGYLNDFMEIKDFTFRGRKIEDLFFLYNLLVNQNKFGPKSITRIFENSLKEDRPGSIIRQFMKFESDLGDVDYDIQDLLIRFADVSGSGYTREWDKNEGKFDIKGESGTLDIFAENNNIILPFLHRTVMTYADVNNLQEKLIDLLTSGKASIKLICDE